MRRVGIAILLCCVLVAGSLTVRAAESESDKVARLFPLQNMEPERAMLEVQAAYPESITRVEMQPQRASGASYLRVIGPAREMEAIARILAAKDVAPPAVSLQVILLEAVDAPLPAPDLPGGAQSALAEVRALFPFKGYRQRHTAVIPAARSAMASLGNEFGVRLDARPQSTGNVEVPGFELVRTPARDVPGAQLLGTSFSMKRGETVVLGTSLVPATAKVDADVPRALVVLVTALP
ncbi:MAG TPA: hypothetical protein VFV75_13095 [Candidatus Polarisedimenticolaceae bacterium]|nr:hypothetical protein [Candidatus Polarisedimenticolaceae bacterium]